MFSLRLSLKICFDQFKTWPKNPRVYMGFLLGIALTIIPSYNYANYAAQLNEPLNIFEPFIIIGSLREHMAFILLGLLLILSNAPFVNQRTTYTLIRTSRKSWLLGSMLYIFLSAIIYYIIILFVSIILVCQNGYVADFWSDPIYTLSQLQPHNSYTEYGVYFPYPDLVKYMQPYTALLNTFLLSAAYGSILCGIMFVINLYKGRLAGCIIALGVHACGYIIISEAIFEMPKLSLLANSLLAFHSFKNYDLSSITLDFSYSVFCTLIILLFMSAVLVMRRFDYKISVGDKE